MASRIADSCDFSTTIRTTSFVAHECLREYADGKDDDQEKSLHRFLVVSGTE